MFKKLVSNLPFSPGLLPQVSFYARRITQENAIRRMGLVFAGLTVLMQSLIFLSPPTPSLAGSGNDLIFGGMRTNGTDMSHSQAVNKVVDEVYSAKGDSNGLKALFQYYGVTKEMVQSSRDVYVCSQRANRTVNGINCDSPIFENIRSVGRSSKSTQDVRIDPAGTSKHFYHRPLSVFDKLNPINTYKALELIPNELYILYSCGNIAFTEVPTPTTEIDKKILQPTDGTLYPGEKTTFEITVKNTSNIPINDLTVHDRLNPNLEAVKVSSNGNIQKIKDPSDGERKERVEWTISTLNPGQTFKATVQAKLKETSDKRICNRGELSYISTNDQKVSQGSDLVCLEVEPPPEEPPRIASLPPACNDLSSNATSNRLFIPADITFTALTETNDTQVRHYEFIVNGQRMPPQDSSEFNWTFDEAGDQTVAVVVTFADGTVTKASDCDYVLQTTEEPNEKTDISKAARVVTNTNPVETNEDDERSNNAQNVTVKPNEIIEYTVSVSNVGNVEIKNYSLPEDDLRDVLEYADVYNRDNTVVANYESQVELRGGGTLEDGVVTWSKIDNLRVGETVTKTFFVKVKDKIPSTNTPPSDPLSYDCVMSNIYENSVDIKVDCSAEKELVTSTTTLPNTGPAEVISITSFFIAISFYLYFRNKQLVRELRIIKTEYNGGIA